MARSSTGDSSSSRLDPNKSSPHRKTRNCSSVIRLWWLEILAAAFSISCLVGTIVLLRMLDGKKYESWTIAKVDITPNTLVSILATFYFLQSGFLLPVAECLSQLKWIYFQQRPQTLHDIQTFDEASRGPLGSLKLLCKVRWRAVVASLGALITILALATDPFTQQILSYRTHAAAAANETASIPIAPSIVGEVELNTLNAAIMKGIYVPQMQVPYTCTTAECSWPSYDSIGISVFCEDVSDEMKIQSTPEDTEQEGELNMCTYSSPSGLTAKASWTNSNPPVLTAQFSNTSMFVKVDTVEEDSFEVIGQHGEIAKISSIWLPWAAVRQVEIWNVSKPSAYECVARWCIHRHATTRYTRGQLDDSVTSVETLNTSTPNFFAAEGVPYFNLTLLDTDDTGQSTGSKDPPFFGISVASHELLQSLLNQTLGVGTAGYSQGSLDVWNTNGSSAANTLYLKNEGNCSLTMDQVANSLTNLIRQGLNSTQLAGTAMLPFVYVHVNWSWLTYPAALVFFACVFLVASIAFSFEQEAIVWKSSSLALLFHGLRGWQDGDHDLRSTAKMEAAAERMQVCVAEDDDGSTALLVH